MKMHAVFCFFSARRYWKEEDKLREVYDALCRETADLAEEQHLITEPGDLERVAPGRVLVAVPMSGAVQSMILAAAEKSAYTVLLAGYVEGCFPPECTAGMLACNAAPTVMDCWAVLRRSGRTLLAVNQAELERGVRVAEACRSLREAKLLMIGAPEPWVISVSRDWKRYTELLGVTVEQVEQRALEECYRRVSDREAEEFLAPIRQGASEIREPTPSDLLEAGRMGRALERLLEEHGADGAAVACFSLLSTGTTTCLGVSAVNDSADQVAACEGDLDSACTMLLMKRLASTKPWMANPSLQKDGTVSFSHCTAPLCVKGAPCPYLLRSHHESGIGVSPQVELPMDGVVTACRFSSATGQMTVQLATPVEGPREPTCRTQLRVRWNDPEGYLRTSLGCHQVFAFEDLSAPLRQAAALLGLEVLE